MTVENQQPRIGLRIESLSDLIFGLALSIGSIELLSKPATNLQDITVNVLYFGFSFAILLWTWFGYSRTMAVLPSQSPGSLSVNFVLLFLVAIEPYLFYVLASSTVPSFTDAASIPYALDVAAIFFAQAGLVRIVLVQDRRAKPEDHKRLNPRTYSGFHRTMFAEIAVGSMFLFSALPLQFLWVPTPAGYSRFLIWYSSFAIYFLIRSAGTKPKATALQTQL
jgi:uncharacterized membrane protein